MTGASNANRLLKQCQCIGCLEMALHGTLTTVPHLRKGCLKSMQPVARFFHFAVGSYLVRLSLVRMALPLVPAAFQLYPKWQASGLVLYCK